MIVQDWKKALEKKRMGHDLKLSGETQTEIDSLYKPRLPKRLLEIEISPFLLYVQGTLLKEDHRCLAVVGTRQASIYGLEMAKRISGELARQALPSSAV